LWLLIGLQTRGWARYVWRSLRSVKGALLALIGMGVMGFWLLVILRPPPGPPVPAEQVRLYTPGLLLAYCLVSVLLSRGERTIYFTPAEVNFLFPGPFHRRTLLVYKVVSTLLLGVPTTLVMLAFLRVYASWLLAAYIGLVLTFGFITLLGMALNLLAMTVGAHLYSRGRQVLFGVLAVVAGVVLVQQGAVPGRQSTADWFAQVAATPAWKVISLPLTWFVDAFLATRWWPDLIVPASLALLVDLALFGLVMALDANYLESAAATSARVYARLQRLRRAGLAGETQRGTWARVSLPSLPYWGGVGPTLWRQMTTAMRGLGRLLIVLGVVGVLMVLPLMDIEDKESGILTERLATIATVLTVLLTSLVPFDFRGDVDRIAVLKTLPVPAWRLALAQVLTPVLLLTLIQWIILAAVMPFAGGDLPWLLWLAAYAWPSNFLQFALDNLLFLLFPTRVMVTTPGDFQGIGRNVLFLLVKMLTLGVVAGVCTLAGAVAWWLAQQAGWPDRQSIMVGLVVAWPILVFFGGVTVPCLALAFRAFDVGRDTPA
jgi:hypothetical protein